MRRPTGPSCQARASSVAWLAPGASRSAYYKDPAKSAATFVEWDGRRWSLTGDMGTVAADGTITLLGRGSLCINTGGEKVYPEEVEGALRQSRAVYDVVVVGVPDERWGERVVAVVEPAPGTEPTEGELMTSGAGLAGRLQGAETGGLRRGGCSVPEWQGRLPLGGRRWRRQPEDPNGLLPRRGARAPHCVTGPWGARRPGQIAASPRSLQASSRGPRGPRRCRGRGSAPASLSQRSTREKRNGSVGISWAPVTGCSSISKRPRWRSCGLAAMSRGGTTTADGMPASRSIWADSSAERWLVHEDSSRSMWSCAARRPTECVKSSLRAHVGSPSNDRRDRHWSSLATAMATHWSSPAHG